MIFKILPVGFSITDYMAVIETAYCVPLYYATLIKFYVPMYIQQNKRIKTILWLRSKPTTQRTKSCGHLCNGINVIICTWLANFAAKFVSFIHHLFCTPHRSPKTSTWLAEHWRTFHSFLYESVTAPVFSFDKTKGGDGSFPDTIVADVVNKMVITFCIFGNLTSTLLSHIYFSVLDKLFVSLFCSDAQYFIP